MIGMSRQMNKGSKIGNRTQFESKIGYRNPKGPQTEGAPVLAVARYTPQRKGADS